MSLRLRDYQLACLADVEAAYARGVRRQAVQLPTGGGKTILFSELIRRRGGQALVLAHRDELITQARDKLHMVAPELPCGIVKAERNELGYQVTCASVQTLSRPRRLEQMAGQRFETVVVDEAHHATAATYRAILDEVCSDDTLLLGVSATLRRTDGVALGEVFDEITHELSPLWLIEHGYLVDVRGLEIKVNADFKRLKKVAGDYADDELADMLDATRAYDASIAAFRQHAAARKTLVFAPTVASAEKFAAVFRSAGIRAASVDGTMDLDERRRILGDFSAGRIQVLANCMVLTEGYDEPSVDCILMARPTRSQPLYTQILGRGLRPCPPEKQDCLILDLVSVVRDLDAVTVPTLFGLDATSMAQGSSLTQAVRKAKEIEREKAQAVAEAVGIVSEEVQVFKQRKEMRWVQAEGHRLYTLQAGKETVLVGPEGDGGSWRVAVHVPAVPGRSRAEVRELQGGLDRAYAMGVAEDYVREQGAATLNRPDRWRGGGDPATEAQVRYLKQLGTQAPPGLTKAQASELINAAKAAQIARKVVRR